MGKQTTPLEVLCKGMPAEFIEYLEYCRSLEFHKRPDYSGLRSLFEKVRDHEGFEFDGIFEWMPADEGKKRQDSQMDENTTASSPRLQAA